MLVTFTGHMNVLKCTTFQFTFCERKWIHPLACKRWLVGIGVSNTKESTVKCNEKDVDVYCQTQKTTSSLFDKKEWGKLFLI